MTTITTTLISNNMNNKLILKSKVIIERLKFRVPKYKRQSENNFL